MSPMIYVKDKFNDVRERGWGEFKGIWGSVQKILASWRNVR